MYFASCKITLEIKLLYTQKNMLQVVLLCLSWLTKLTSSVPFTGTSRQNCKQLYFLREERGSGLRFVLFFCSSLGWTNTNFFSFKLFLELPLKNVSAVAIRKCRLLTPKWFWFCPNEENESWHYFIYQNSENKIVSLTRMSGQELITWNASNSI